MNVKAAGRKYEIRTDGRIVALRDFGRVTKDAIGGFIDDEINLSHSGNAWVREDARVTGNAKVTGNAQVFGNARVSDNAWVEGDARISQSAWISGNAKVDDNARITGNARIGGNAQIGDNARVSGNARIDGDATVDGSAWVGDNAWIYGNAWVNGIAQIYDNAKIAHIIDVQCIRLPGRDITIYRAADGHRIAAGCQTFTLNDNLKKIAEKHAPDLVEFIDLYLPVARAIVATFERKSDTDE